MGKSIFYYPHWCPSCGRHWSEDGKSKSPPKGGATAKKYCDGCKAALTEAALKAMQGQEATLWSAEDHRGGSQLGHGPFPNEPLTQEQEDERKEERRLRKIRSRARSMLPVLYDDLETSTGKTRRGIEDEIDELERLLEEQGLAYDQESRKIWAIPEEDEEIDAGLEDELWNSQMRR